MGYCAVIGCNNRTDRNKRKSGIGFHVFPRNAALKKLWIKALRRDHWEPSPHSVICSEHFSENDVNKTYQSGLKLRENAVPTIFPAYPDHSKKVVKSCVFHNCKNRNIVNADQCGLKFFSFPTNPTLRQAWIRAALRTPVSYDDFVTKGVDPRICSDHFFPEDFELKSTGRELKPYAVPIIFHVTYHDEESAPKRKRHRKILDPFFQFDLKHCSVEIPEKERRLADEKLFGDEIEVKEEEPELLFIDDDGREIEDEPPPAKSPRKQPSRAVTTSQHASPSKDPKINVSAGGNVTPKSSAASATTSTPAVAKGTIGSGSNVPSVVETSVASATTSTPTIAKARPEGIRFNPAIGNILTKSSILKATPVANKPLAPIPSNLKRLKSKKLVIKEKNQTAKSTGGSGLVDHESYTLPTSQPSSELAPKAAGTVSKPLPVPPLAPLSVPPMAPLIRTSTTTPRQQPQGGGTPVTTPLQPQKPPRKLAKDATNDEVFRERLGNLPLAQLMIFHPGVRLKISAHFQQVKVLLQQIRRLEDRLAKTTEKLTWALRSCKTGVNQATKKIDSLLILETVPKCECNKKKAVDLLQGAPRERLDDIFCDAASRDVPSTVESQEIVEDNERLIKKIISINNGLKGKEIIRVVVVQAEDLL